ncbi:hypothetical protein BT67DRAFT_265598 [Trichocladium antarcticum]|uniref:Uncharacterized protein n=1 Tax=Trichocladium antarcticum TaxID=1450529 RepID=A0AAN6ZF07_9PEZI|nr:hypothetical protein BT67DRAFT_265598 [Trichocladium antarcticum]
MAFLAGAPHGGFFVSGKRPAETARKYPNPHSSVGPTLIYLQRTLTGAWAMCICACTVGPCFLLVADSGQSDVETAFDQAENTSDTGSHPPWPAENRQFPLFWNVVSCVCHVAIIRPAPEWLQRLGRPYHARFPLITMASRQSTHRQSTDIGAGNPGPQRFSENGPHLSQHQQRQDIAESKRSMQIPLWPGYMYGYPPIAFDAFRIRAQDRNGSVDCLVVGRIRFGDPNLPFSTRPKSPNQHGIRKEHGDGAVAALQNRVLARSQGAPFFFWDSLVKLGHGPAEPVARANMAAWAFPDIVR